VLLHAAAFIPEIKRTELIQPLVSYKTLVEKRIYHSEFIPTAVAGSLAEYDLPDLAASLAPRQLLIVNPVNGNNEPVAAQQTGDLDFVRQAFAAQGNENALSIIQDEEDKVITILEGWLE
ncbi:MAG TPA: hypothetical protein VFT90_11920, partial [Chryseosolibacter sp.]|nr:hypothetical protein [Chryseosolibacter sp.]